MDRISLLLVLACVLLGGCANLEPHRIHYAEQGCSLATPRPALEGCQDQMWERVGDDFDVLYAEFDDMGLAYPQTDDPNDRAWDQIGLVTQSLRKLAKDQGISVVVYVHGWKHSAQADDPNVEQFHHILRAVSAVEKASSKRRVVGVYLGWRGLSIKYEPFKEATFWSRKTAALHVAEGSARHFLVACERFNGWRIASASRVSACQWPRSLQSPSRRMRAMREVRTFA